MNYTFRMHDPRIGRFFAVDPLVHDYPSNSPYAFSENRVIDGIELEGGEVRDYRLDLDDKGHRVGFKFSGNNTHGIHNWSIWNLFGVKIPAVDIYQKGKFVARYSFNTEGQGGFKTLKKFAEDEKFRNEYINSNLSLEQYNKKIADDIGQTFEDGIRTAATMNYAVSRVNDKSILKIAPKIATIKTREIIVDQNLSPTIVTKLKEAGYTVKRFADGTLDPVIIQYAKENNAVVLTNNIKDFKNQGINTISVSEKLKTKANVDKVVDGVKAADVKYSDGNLPVNIPLTSGN